MTTREKLAALEVKIEAHKRKTGLTDRDALLEVVAEELCSLDDRLERLERETMISARRKKS